MVFCGKPSAACGNCRTRRIKCDQVETGCSQCIRAAQTCPGYRKVDGLRVRDESNRVIRKAIAQRDSRIPKRESSEISSRESSPSSFVVGSETTQSWLSRIWKGCSGDSCACTTIDNQGVCFFMSHYLLLNPITLQSSLALAKSQVWRHVNPSKAVVNAVTAVGLAGLANVRQDESLMVTARKRYATAIQMTLKALVDPQEIKQDRTLRAVALLAIFESVSSTSLSTKSWTSHTGGAAALLNLRSVTDLKDSDNIRLLIQIGYSIYTGCLLQDQGAPPKMIDWQDLAKNYESEIEYPACALVIVASRFVDSHLAIKNGQIDCGTALRIMIAYEAELSQWSESLPLSWLYKTETILDPTEDFFENKCHVYRNIWMANEWNHYRLWRMLIHGSLLEQLDGLTITEMQAMEMSPVQLEMQRLDSLKILEQMALDICASVPFLMEKSNLSSGTANRWKPPPQIDVQRGLPFAGLSAAFTLIRPLQVATSSRVASVAMCEWTASLMERIERRVGVRQALAVAIDIRKRLEELRVGSDAEEETSEIEFDIDSELSFRTGVAFQTLRSHV